MLKKHIIFLILSIAAAPLFTFCLFMVRSCGVGVHVNTPSNWSNSLESLRKF